LVGDIFMSLNESKQASSFVDRPGGGLYGGNNLMSIIDHPMTLVARPTFESTLAHQGCIRIAGTAKLAVSLVSSASWALGARTSSSRVRRRLVVLFVLWLIELLDLLPRGLLAKEPQVIESLRDNPHQFPFTLNILQKQQKHHAQDH
jgi:hypothetical protein